MNATHAHYKRALFPLAKAALERRDYGNIALIESEAHLESLAWTVANYAATDLVLRRRTVLLDMEDVCEALPELRPAMNDARRDAGMMGEAA